MASEDSQLVTNGDVKRRFWLVLAASAALLLMLLFPAMLGRVYVVDDLVALVLPSRLLYAESLRRGESLSWSPWVDCGWDIQGEANYYHPVLAALYRVAPPLAAYAVELVAAYPILFVGMYWLLRRRRFPKDAAALGAMMLAFSGFSLSHFNHTSMILVVAHIPWLLAAIDVLLHEPSGSKAAWAWLAISLLTASQLLTGFPQAVWFSLICESAYALLVISRHGGMKRAFTLIAAKVLGALTGSLQLLLAWQSLSLSTRDTPTVDFVSSFSMHPAFLTQLLVPTFFKNFFDHPCSDEFMLFDGAMTLVLCAWAARRWRCLAERRGIVALAGGFVVVGLLLALGGYWPKIYLLQRYLPLVGKFRCPCRYIFFVHFGMAIVAAAAMADLAKQATGGPRRTASWLWLIAGASLIACAAGVVLKLRGLAGVSDFIASPWQMFAGLALIVAAVGMTVVAAGGSRWALAGIIVCAAVERAIYLIPVLAGAHSIAYSEFVDGVMFPPVGDYAIAYRDYVDGVLVPPASTRHRVLVQEPDCWCRPALSVRALRNASGYAVLQPVRALDNRVDAAAEALEVEWVYADGRWRRLADPVAYVRLAPKCVQSNRPREDLKRIDVHDTVLVEEDIRLPPGPAGTAELLSDSPGRLNIKTHAALDRILAVAESYHPGWQARIDGAPAMPIRLYGDLLGCFVPAGEHRVELTYHSAALELGTELSLSGFLASLVFFALWQFAIRRRSMKPRVTSRANSELLATASLGPGRPHLPAAQTPSPEGDGNGAGGLASGRSGPIELDSYGR